MDNELYQGDESQSLLWDMLSLFTNPVYMFTMFTVSCMYFSSSGLQFWTISYLEKILNVDVVHAQVIFIACASSAPIPGALLGSFVADAFGGYKGKNQLTALKICCIFGFIDGIVAVWVCYIKDVETFTFALFSLLFLGATIVPSSYGIIVSCVRKEQQNASSAFGTFFFNFAGFFLAPNVSGYVID